MASGDGEFSKSTPTRIPFGDHPLNLRGYGDNQHDPLRKDDTHKSRSVNNWPLRTKAHQLSISFFFVLNKILLLLLLLLLLLMIIVIIIIILIIMIITITIVMIMIVIVITIKQLKTISIITIIN